jgi:hypothetical protein
MLQRYDIWLNEDENRLSIREFAAIGRLLRRKENYDHTQENYSLIHEVSWDGDLIRDAIKVGQDALISELRSDDFFPTHSCAKMMAREVTNIFKDNPESVFKMYFDDRSTLSGYNEK